MDKGTNAVDVRHFPVFPNLSSTYILFIVLEAMFLTAFWVASSHSSLAPHGILGT
jgi:hypothetical protein